jgi:hypothetical protein
MIVRRPIKYPEPTKLGMFASLMLRPGPNGYLTSAVEAFELFNNVRNDHSLAHDNQLIERAEARFIFDAIVNFLRYIKAIEGQNFEGAQEATLI